MGRQHKWVATGRIDPADCNDTEWVLRDPGSGTRSVFEAALAILGVPPHSLRVALEVPSNEAVRGAVEAGLLHGVDMKLPEREVHALRHAERTPSRAATALLALIGRTV